MKKSKLKSFDYSPKALRDKARVPMPPPSFRMKDRKHAAKKYACRSKEH